MGYLFDERKLINDNAFIHEERLNSQYARFLEGSPTFVTYYHINNIESTTDNGFNSVERILGTNSPIRFNQIDAFPIYGLSSIMMNLNDELQGLDSSYDGEGIILPNTVKPLPNDIFTIDYLDRDYLFMVTSVSPGTIKSNDFYKIEFTIKSLHGEHTEYLDKQTIDGYTTVIDNIGSKEKVIIHKDDVDQLISLETIYNNMAEYYKLLFFDKKYNSFILTTESGKRLYDPFASMFINKFGLFNEKRKLDTIYLSIENRTPLMTMEYHNSFYQTLELRNVNLLKDKYLYNESYVNDITSIFHHYKDDAIKSVSLSNIAVFPYIPEDIITSIKSGTIEDGVDIKNKVIVDFFINLPEQPRELDFDTLNNYFLYMKNDKETFTLIPIMLYILRIYYKKFMSIS